MHAQIAHRTRLAYDEEVSESVMDTRLGPYTDTHQRWDSFLLRTAPIAAVRRYTDGFGNAAHLVTLARAHTSVDIIAEGSVQTLLSDPFADGAPLEPLGPLERSDYLRPSALVPRLDAIAALAAPHLPAGPGDELEAARALMHNVHDEFRYASGVTSTESTVQDVLDAGAGVCQDFAHVLLGLCRSIGLPARYVSGYVVEREQAPARGRGASHAWTEVFLSTHGWRGFDPTHDLVASEHHVKLAVGRDYRDVAPTRGTFRGIALESLSVEVHARPAEDATPLPSPWLEEGAGSA